MFLKNRKERFNNNKLDELVNYVEELEKRISELEKQVRKNNEENDRNNLIEEWSRDIDE